MLELQLLNSILVSRDATALVRNGLMDRNQWLTHQEAYLFVVKHLKDYGELPSISTAIQSIDNFEAVDIAESPDTLCKKIIERNLKNKQKQFFVDIAKRFGELDAYDILAAMEEKVSAFQKISIQHGSNGIDWATSGSERAKEYENRKKKDFSRRVPFLFHELTKILGEMNGGFYLTIMGFTARGKSWLGLKQALAAHEMGLNVLVESGEMSKSEVAFRLDSLKGNYSNRGLYTGSLDFHTEEQYLKWLDKFNKENGQTPLVIKTQEDWAYGLTLHQIEHDIQIHKPDVLILDQFSLIRHISSDRNGMTNTSRKLKELAGKYGIVVVLLYQANGEYEKRKGQEKAEENSVKELTPPRLSDYSETIAIIQDSDAVLTFDSVIWRDEQTRQQCGKAILAVGKSRNGGEGTELDIQWIPDFGIIKVKQATDAF